MEKSSFEQNIIFSLLKKITQLTKRLENVESYEDEEKILKLLYKVSSILVKVNKLKHELQFDFENEEKYQFGASEIAIMESYIEKLKQEKLEKGEKVW